MALFSLIHSVFPFLASIMFVVAVVRLLIDISILLILMELSLQNIQLMKTYRKIAFGVTLITVVVECINMAMEGVVLRKMS